MEAILYNTQGKKAGSVNLPESVFGVKWNDSLMHQVVTSMIDNARTPVAHTKNRGDVSGGGKKPWQQKGTGRARHGSSRSPIWRHGGKAHGPRNEKDYSRTIPKKMRAKALYMALSKKLQSGEIIFVNGFEFKQPKTSDAKKFLVAMSSVAGYDKLVTKKNNSALVAFAENTESSVKSFRNIGNVACTTVRELNPVAVLKSKYLVIENPEMSLAAVEARTKKKAK